MEPIAVGGALVLPGDIIVGDDDGVVVVPPHVIPQVVEVCRRWLLCCLVCAARPPPTTSALSLSLALFSVPRARARSLSLPLPPFFFNRSYMDVIPRVAGWSIAHKIYTHAAAATVLPLPRNPRDIRAGQAHRDWGYREVLSLECGRRTGVPGLAQGNGDS